MSSKIMITSNNITTATSTDRQSVSVGSNTPSSTPLVPNQSDERHPLMDHQSIPIDNNVINSIINSIISPTPKQHQQQQPPNSLKEPIEGTTTTTNDPNNGSSSSSSVQAQYLLPVDLLVSVDKSNKPTVQAAIPSAFAFQPPTTTTLAPLTPLTPLAIPSFPAFTPTASALPAMPTFTTAASMNSIPQHLASIPQAATLQSIPMTMPFLMSQPMCSMPMSIPQQYMDGMTASAVPPPSIPPPPPSAQQSVAVSMGNTNYTLNPSAVSFTPSKGYTPFGVAAISEQQPVFNENMNKKQKEEDMDAWCIIDEQTDDDKDNNKKSVNQQGQTIDLKNVPPIPLTSPSYKWNKAGYGGYRQYQRNWRNGLNKGENERRNNLHISYRLNRAKRDVVPKQPTIKLLVEFVKHVTLPIRATYPANTVLTKTWAMKNVGRIPWGYGVELVYCKGDENLPLYKRYPVNNAKPGQEIEISATIKTPNEAGRYCTYFRLQKNGRFFGPRVWVDVIVAGDNPLNERISSNICSKDIGKSVIKEHGHQNKMNKWKRKYEPRRPTYAHQVKMVSCK